ncbi:GntR family transcriptional regulator [Streptomyces sp. NRRL F-5135]|uniref:GntR family transcriptional regulator n=1 Tax=Streptomyces sp. NRRL F-5135 TaxID=1463858 RepID=UPI0004C63BDE|nr:GntR family transcriptional regulator [Streptomyces sp. NRRL F-5135]
MSDHRLTRTRGLYVQVADQLTDAIANGEYQPGDALPSEARLMERYQISRPTIRSAMAELRTRGLVEVRQGVGTLVRKITMPSLDISRAITRRGTRHGLGWEGVEAEYAAVTRGHTTGVAARLLERDEEAVFVAERVLTDRDTGVRAAHRTVIPFDVADSCPPLAKSPDACPTALYDALTDAAGPLNWTEHVTARAPMPDERATLQLAGSEPVLITYRVTADADGHPLMLEEFCISATQATLAYPITPQKAPAKRRS